MRLNRVLSPGSPRSPESHVATFMADLQEQHVALYLHQQNVDGTTSAGRAMLGMASVFAAFERDMLIERINAGLARARAQGKQLGRPKTELSANALRDIRKLHAQGTGIGKIARRLGVGAGKVSRVLAQ
jgi:DNA invertase Pin-like site-specific DNA recombinase